MAVDPLSGNALPQIAGAIRQAAQTTGVSFQYLLTTAQIESNLNPAAKASTSSAKGLYQFIDQTWLGTMKQDGPALGYSRYADAVARGADGRYRVDDPAMRTAIMRLRNDPGASAMLAGALTRNNAAQLSKAIGRAPSEGELYIAHFLGPSGAGKLIGTAANHPRANAAAMFPQAAAANPSIFYERSGSPRSTRSVYATLTGRFDVARNTAIAHGLGGNAVATASPPDTAGIAAAYAEAGAKRPPPPDTKPLFEAMFTDRVRTALAPTVNNLWAMPKNAPPSGPGAPTAPLDLFSDGRGDVRKLFGNS